MESLFASNKEFFEGDNIFTPIDEEFLFHVATRRPRRSEEQLRRAGVVAASRKFLVSLTVGAAAVLSVGFTAPGTAPMTPEWTIEAAVPPDQAPDPAEFRAARKSLGLSQRKAAAVLHVSEPALEQFEQNRVTPGRAFSARYQALVDLSSLLRESLGDDSGLIATYLRGTGIFFSGMPPLEWAANVRRPDAISEILAIYRRMLS
jgi:transcriptional regulator with XRE-family HTH domain